jgi:hypothetical protein
MPISLSSLAKSDWNSGLCLGSFVQYHICYIIPSSKVMQFTLGNIYGELQWVFWLCHRCRCSGLLDAGKWSNSWTLSWGCNHWWRCKCRVCLSFSMHSHTYLWQYFFCSLRCFLFILTRYSYLGPVWIPWSKV